MTDPLANLERFHPLDALAPEHLRDLKREVRSMTLSKGETVFELGSKDNNSYYLADGTLHCEFADDRLVKLEAGTEPANYAVGNLLPRQFDARVASDTATMILVDRERLEKLLAWSQMAAEPSVELTEFNPSEHTGEWVFSMMNTKLFRELPTSNIMTFFANTEKVPVSEGDVIIEQGESGDYFYLIKAGEAVVERQEEGHTEEIARLTDGESFGEEALISSLPRNATVRMASDGILLRLDKTDFEQLLKQPMLNWVTFKQALPILKNERGVLLDVRMENEHLDRAIKGSVNIPLYRLRQDLEKLKQGRPYICYCNTGARSSTAAYLLGQNGFNAYVLEGGLSSLGG